MVGIYKFTNLVNGKIYIGQSINIEERRKSHIRASNSKKCNGYNYYLHKAFRKYGLENFKFEVIEECNKEQLNEREMFWINQYKSFLFENGYNMTTGGDNTSYHLQRPIYQIDLKTKKIVREYPSCFEAGRCLGKNQANIRHCCEGKYRYSYGYIWRYKDSYDPKELVSINYDDQILSFRIKTKKVYQYNKMTGKLLNEFNSSAHAEKEIGVKRSAIQNCLVNRSKSAGGFFWSYNKKEELKNDTNLA